ncbi:MAG: YfcE family phosphodiesterase [Acidimicrobiia bacterium]|nr:YfcE family phosphodiesterase [Acidimicrobiia bacterium]
MRVVVLSDTHLPGHRELGVDVQARVEAADVVLHAGDITSPVVLERLAATVEAHAVLGNNDVELAGVLPERLELVLGGVRVAIVHDSGPTAGRERRLRRWFPEADLVVFGHSHMPFSGPGVGGQRLLNPGSPTQRRRSPSHTLAELDVEGGAVLDVRFVDLGP